MLRTLHSTGASPSETDKPYGGQFMPRILWYTKVHYHVHKSSQPLLILRQNNPAHDPNLLLEGSF